MQQAVVDAGRPLPQLTDPLEVELQVSAFVGPFADNEELWEVVVHHLRGVPSRRSAALLTALGHLLPGRPGRWAEEAALEQGAPPWDMGALRFGECWIGDRSIDAGYLALLCSYAYGDEPHAMVFMIDEISGGLTRHAFLSRQVDEALERLKGQVRLESITAEAAHWLLSRSYDRFERRPGLGVGLDVHHTRLVARRRIKLAMN
ncbi:hypothetical protein C8D88_12242 [Lentzea atacamensis]|uniref:Uncharacterized protein n=1 Tax=Lentzea atacamensis TaxID=531938 RepID=A0A316HHV5_9PSEU|nr:hypothetical protein [Lentzea atacamensis]PWK80764.1 hypothetical protein C8D88_12242 [Lentzea atacamensis]RAS64854.1 hypothetical protein C8D87_105348 [Lentzea atacamensis]